VAEASHAVFLSYASQDAGAAQKIAEALRAGDIEVFLDQSELRGGDAWDQKIRHEIHDCALFIPVVSQHTQERLEGYFRREWKLAIDRSHDMAAQKAFLVPVVVDGTGDQEAFVPDEFREVQWTRLPAGETPPEFVTRIRKLLSGESAPIPTLARKPPAVTPKRSSRLAPAALVLVLGAVAAYLVVEKPWIARFAPPPHSVAVLPFVNMSGDKEQEYFSDGLTEELLNALAEINELQVAARTSAFSFKGKDTDIGTIARKLNVGAVLEGSVRRSGNTVRITTQLINAATGYRLWSHTYDRDLGDVLKLETEIAGAVASALTVSLLGDEATKIELGGTRNPAAFDAYLRASKAYLAVQSERDLQAAIAGYTEAIRLDPDYAVAYADRSLANLWFARDWVVDPTTTRDYLNQAQADARKAIAIAPDLAEGHLALANVYEGSLEFASASKEYERALTLAPGNARLLKDYGSFAVFMGQTETGLAALQRSVVLDPLNYLNHVALGWSLWAARRYSEAITALKDARALAPINGIGNYWLALAYLGSGDVQSAHAACVNALDNSFCLALVYEKLGRHSDAESALAKLRATSGDGAAVYYATIYAQWGDTLKALEWLDTAMRLRDPLLEYLKKDPLMDPLRKEPRFQAVERELKFPD